MTLKDALIAQCYARHLKTRNRENYSRREFTTRVGTFDVEAAVSEATDITYAVRNLEL